MKLNEKINELANNFAITDEELMEAYLLGKPSCVDENTFLTYHAVMRSTTRLPVRVLHSFLLHFLKRIGHTDGEFTTAVTEVSVGYNNKGANYLVESLGRYHLSTTLALLDNKGEIEEFSNRLAG